MGAVSFDKSSLLPIGSIEILRRMSGTSHGCPSKGKTMHYKFDNYKQQMGLTVNSVTTNGSEGSFVANIKIDLPEGYEARKRVENGTTKHLTPQERGKDTYWVNLFWTKGENNNLTVAPNDLLDIVRIKDGSETPVATIDILDVHPEGQIVGGSPVEWDYIFANLLHAAS